MYLGTSNQDGRGNPAATDDRLSVLENRTYLAATSVRVNARPEALTLTPNPASGRVLRRRGVGLGPATGRVRDGRGRTVQQAAFAAG